MQNSEKTVGSLFVAQMKIKYAEEYSIRQVVDIFKE